MKIKALVAGAALATTGLIGAGASPASAGCGINIELHNPGDVGSTVDWDQSEVRTRYGWWRDLGSGSTYVGPGDRIWRNLTLDFSCNTDRRYRLDVNQDGSSWFVYHPSPDLFTDITTLHFDVD